jgi:hypothetical protein
MRVCATPSSQRTTQSRTVGACRFGHSLAVKTHPMQATFRVSQNCTEVRAKECAKSFQRVRVWENQETDFKRVHFSFPSPFFCCCSSSFVCKVVLRVRKAACKNNFDQTIVVSEIPHIGDQVSNSTLILDVSLFTIAP